MVDKLKWIIVSSNEVEQSKFRLEASVFNIEAKAAKKTIETCNHPKVKLWSENGLIKNAFYPGRFKRIYVEKGYGFPMVLPSQMLSIKPIATKFISAKTYNTIGSLDLKKGQLLLSRSGTIGNCTIVSKTLENTVMSDDVIRITFKEDCDLGYVYAFFKTKMGQLVLATNNYGSVVQHIEPEHLSEITIPKPDLTIRQSIHDKIIKSFKLRDQSNDLIEKAELLLINSLKLPPIDQLKEEYFQQNVGFKNYTVPLSFLDDRLDGSYHLPIVNSIIDSLLDSGAKVSLLGNSELTSNIYIPNRFKRVYLEEKDNGTPFFSGRCINELDPSNKKYISSSLHKDRIGKQLLIKENMLLITCSGTTGKVNIVPPHWNNWVMTHDIIRVVPVKDFSGYLYIWLNSEYGKILLQRFDYGSVVPHIESEHALKVPIPIIENKELIKEINDLAIQANKLRSEAYYLEQESILQINEDVFYA